MKLVRLLSTLSCVFLFAMGSAEACPDIDGLLDRNCDRQLKIVAFGDSITFGVADREGLGYPGRLQEIFPNARVINLGDPGEDTVRGKVRAAREFANYPDADFIIILEGVNDYFITDRSAFRTASNLFSMEDSGESLGALTLLSRLTEIRRGEQRPWVLSVNAALGGAAVIDFFSLGKEIISGDLLHPDGAGYQEMAFLVADVLREATLNNRPRDRDGDGIYDFAEPRFGTDRNVADSDGDGLNDGLEIFTYGSNPLSLDSDNDGFRDDFEVNTLGSNPADPRPSPPTVTTIEVF